MGDKPLTVGRLAEHVRSKNAGPFWQTLDVFLRTDADYQALIDSQTLSRESIGRLYQVEPQSVEIFHIARLRVIKISFPRAVPAGSFEDTDQHAGQQHVPLAGLALRTQPRARAAGREAYRTLRAIRRLPG